MNDTKQDIPGSLNTVWEFLFALIRYAMMVPWLLGVLLFFGIIVALYILAHNEVSYVDGTLILKPITSQAKYRGFYVDIRETTPQGRKFYVAYEDFDMDKYESGVIKAWSRGEVEQGKSTIRKEWRVIGYFSGEFTFMSYITTRDEGQRSVPSGVGTYVLQRKGNNYTGYIVFRDSANDVTLECPYVLSLELRMKVEEAKVRWPQLNEDCKNVVFPPAP